eukprot:5461534-Pyramimonas_sp.AAC.1
MPSVPPRIWVRGSARHPRAPSARARARTDPFHPCAVFQGRKPEEEEEDEDRRRREGGKE